MPGLVASLLELAQTGASRGQNYALTHGNSLWKFVLSEEDSPARGLCFLKGVLEEAQQAASKVRACELLTGLCRDPRLVEYCGVTVLAHFIDGLLRAAQWGHFDDDEDRRLESERLLDKLKAAKTKKEGTEVGSSGSLGESTSTADLGATDKKEGFSIRKLVAAVLVNCVRSSPSCGGEKENVASGGLAVLQALCSPTAFEDPLVRFCDVRSPPEKRAFFHWAFSAAPENEQSGTTTVATGGRDGEGT